MVMRDWVRARLLRNLAELEQELQGLEGRQKDAPESVIEGWVGTSKARGTAGRPSQAKNYWTVRSYEPRPQWGGKKQRHIPVKQPELLAAYRDACDRGQRLRKLRKQRDRLQARLDAG